MKPPRLIRTPHTLPRLVLDRAEKWARGLGVTNGHRSTVIRDGRGHRFDVYLSCNIHLVDGYWLQVADLHCDVIAGRQWWPTSPNAAAPEGLAYELARRAQLSKWRTYDRPSGKRRTLESRR